MKVPTTMKISKLEEGVEQQHQQENAHLESADFETAIALTGYGKFNIALFLATMMGILTSQFDTSAISFILASAGCDLEITEYQKGWIISSTYLGMVISASVWGLFADTLCRRNIIIYGFLIDGIVALAGAFSPNFIILFIFKFLNGLIVSGPNAVLMSFVAENHSSKVRARIMMMIGLYYSLGTILGPLFGLVIIPVEFLNFSIWDFEIKSWRIYMIVCALPGILAAIVFYPFFESPKFLMTSGKNDEALEIFRRIYSINTGKPKDTFPVKSLKNEIKNEANSHAHLGTIAMLRIGWQQVVILFTGNYLKLALLNFALQFGAMLSQNTLRLWLPQLFTTVEEFYTLIEDTPFVNSSFTLCEMIDGLKQNNDLNETTMSDIPCGAGALSSPAYINSIIMGVMGIFGYAFVSYIVNIVGKKIILMVTFILASICSFAVYWTSSTMLNLFLLGTFVSALGINATAMISVVVDLFPTTMRTMAVGLTMMSGRIGTIIGSVIFPVLVDLGGCFCPFIVVGILTGAMTLLSLRIPRTLGKALE